MTISSEQLRADFEVWAASIGFCVTGKYAETIDVLCAKSAFKAGYQAGRAALQSQDREDAERYRAWRKAVASQNGNFLRLVSNELPDWDEGPVDEEKIDAAIDHARHAEKDGNKC